MAALAPLLEHAVPGRPPDPVSRPDPLARGPSAPRDPGDRPSPRPADPRDRPSGTGSPLLPPRERRRSEGRDGRGARQALRRPQARDRAGDPGRSAARSATGASRRRGDRPDRPGWVSVLRSGLADRPRWAHRTVPDQAAPPPRVREVQPGREPMPVRALEEAGSARPSRHRAVHVLLPPAHPALAAPMDGSRSRTRRPRRRRGAQPAEPPSGAHHRRTAAGIRATSARGDRGARRLPASRTGRARAVSSTSSPPPWRS